MDSDRLVLFVITYCGRIKINTNNATDTANKLHVARRHVKTQFLFPFPKTRFIKTRVLVLGLNCIYG